MLCPCADVSYPSSAEFRMGQGGIGWYIIHNNKYSNLYIIRSVRSRKYFPSSEKIYQGKILSFVCVYTIDRLSPCRIILPRGRSTLSLNTLSLHTYAHTKIRSIYNNNIFLINQGNFIVHRKIISDRVYKFPNEYYINL
mgnify:CR=1 FL=1